MNLPTRASLGLLFLLVPLTLVPPALAQQATRPRPVLLPEVHADLQVTFRLRAPSAEEVSLAGEFMDGARAMKRGDDGVWSITVGPIEPEVYEDEFTIDGVTFLDPRNADVKTNQGPSGISSLLTVRGDEPLFFDVCPVPHGTVEIRTYDSGVTGLSRQVYIYTPPGYDEGTETLPVLYLLHGADGEDRSWTMLGRAHTMLDNLIADGRSAPMVIVIPYGYAYRWDTDDPPADVIHLVSYEPDAATFGRISRDHHRVFVYLVLDVGRPVAHRLRLDTEEGPERALVCVPAESITYCLENF